MNEKASCPSHLADFYSAIRSMGNLGCLHPLDCVGTVLSAPCGVALAALYWNDLLPWLSVCT